MGTHEVLQLFFPVHHHFQQVGDRAIQRTTHTPRHLRTLAQRGVNLLLQLLNLFWSKRILDGLPLGIGLLVFIELLGFPAPCGAYPWLALTGAALALATLLLLEAPINLPCIQTVILVVERGMLPHLDEPISFLTRLLIQHDVNYHVGCNVGSLRVCLEQVLQVHHVHQHDVVVLMQDDEAAGSVVQAIHELATIDDSVTVGCSGGEVVNDFPITNHQDTCKRREARVAHDSHTLLGNDLRNRKCISHDYS